MRKKLLNFKIVGRNDEYDKDKLWETVNYRVR